MHSSRVSFRTRESRELLGGDLDRRARGETRRSIDLPEEEELEQLPDRLGTAPRAFATSTLSGDLGGELVGGGGRSEKIAVASIEFCVSCLLDQPLSYVVVVIVVAIDDVVVLMEYVGIVLLDVDTLLVLFSLRRFNSSMFCEVISIVALLSRKKSSLIGSWPLISRSCFCK